MKKKSKKKIYFTEIDKSVSTYPVGLTVMQAEKGPKLLPKTMTPSEFNKAFKPAKVKTDKPKPCPDDNFDCVLTLKLTSAQMNTLLSAMTGGRSFSLDNIMINSGDIYLKKNNARLEGFACNVSMPTDAPIDGWFSRYHKQIPNVMIHH